MSVRVAETNGVKVYTIAGGKTLPTWAGDQKKRGLKKNEEYTRRVELIQDFGFPEACQRLKASPDGQYIFGSGYHPPRVRVFDTEQLSLKFERHLTSEVVDFQILSGDYSKAVFLCADRSLDIHARWGAYYRLRVPRTGRTLAYHSPSAELLAAGSAPEVWRLDLAAGRFLAPLPSRSPGVNAVVVSPLHGLVAAAGEDGAVECFDPRARRSLGALRAGGGAATALRFDRGGMRLAVGSGDGTVAIFDLRSSRPLLRKDHAYGAAVRDVKFHSGGREAGGGEAGSEAFVVSADRHIVKVWSALDGATHANMEPPAGSDVNDVCLFPGSGLMLAGCDAPRIQAWFLPSLGPAPRWCSFLESLTEELEERDAGGVWDDYRFVTRADVAALGLEDLVGTPALRAYMHGFFVDARLHARARAAADPAASETHRRRALERKEAEARASRIGLPRKAPRVNARLAERLELAAEEGGEAAHKRKRVAAAAGLLRDERFADLFRDEDFAVDEASQEFRLLNPSVAASRALLDEHFEPAQDKPYIPWLEDSSDEEGARWRRQKKERRDKTIEGAPLAERRRDGEREARGPRLYAARDAAAAAAFKQGRSLAGERAASLGERAAELGDQAVRPRATGAQELSFRPRGGRGGDGRGAGGRGAGRGRGRGRGRGAPMSGGRGGGGRGGGRGRGRGRH